MFFKDWRECDQSLVDLTFDKGCIYYVHAQAWHLKGYLGGRHSYITWWSTDQKCQLVVEYTDKETLDVQNANIIYEGRKEYSLHAPFISDRAANARWFGHDPIVKGICSKGIIKDEDFVTACKLYPNALKDFDLLKNNCNTFTSYLLYKMRLEISQPHPAIGYKSRQRWSNSGA